MYLFHYLTISSPFDWHSCSAFKRPTRPLILPHQFMMDLIFFFLNNVSNFCHEIRSEIFYRLPSKINEKIVTIIVGK